MTGSVEDAAAPPPGEARKKDQLLGSKQVSSVDAILSVAPFAWPIVALIVFATLSAPMVGALRAVGHRLTHVHSLKAGALEIVVNESALPLVPSTVANALAGLSPSDVEKLLRHSYANCNHIPPPRLVLMGIVKKQAQPCATLTTDVGTPTRAYLFRLVAAEVANAQEPIDLSDGLTDEEK